MSKMIRWFLLCVIIWCLPISFGYGQTYYPFHLGNHAVEETTVLFEFPDESVTALYAFNFGTYPALSEETNQARIRLYDRRKNLIAEGKSICVKAGGSGVRFGSISFPSVTRGDVDQSAFFTLEAIPCQKGKNRISAENDPQLRPLAEAVDTIVQILFPCLQTGESEKECICMNRDRLKEPVRKAASFLETHPEFTEKELAFYESNTSNNGGAESLTLSLSLKEVGRFQDDINDCE